MRINWPRLLTFAAAGLVYGIVLVFLGFCAGGAGHGTLVVIGLVSSPLVIFGNGTLALFGTPIWWSTVGLALGAAEHKAWRAAFLVAMIAHYGGLILIVPGASEFADWELVKRAPAMVAVAFGFYLFGQVVLWIALPSRPKPERRSSAS